MEQRIRALLPEMPSATAKVALFLLENPQAPLTLSIGELAERAGASAATVTRFCRTIGFRGYVALRVTIATDLGHNTAMDSVAKSSLAMESWVSEIGESFGPEDSADELLNMLVGVHTRTLRETSASIDLSTLSQVAALIAACEQVDIYGVGGSAQLASDLQGRLYRIGIRAYNWAEVHTGLASAAIQGPGTVALGVSLSGRTEETVQMLDEARNAGAHTVAMVTDRHSPLAELAEYRIVTSMTDHFLKSDDLSANHGQLLVVDLLYLLVAQVNFDRSSTKLAASASAVAPHRRSPHTDPSDEGPRLG